MKCSTACIFCLLKRQEENLRQMAGVPEEEKAGFLCEVLKLVGDRAGQETAPQLFSRVSRLHQDFFGRPYSMEAEKRRYNDMMLQKEDFLRGEIRRSGNPLLTAVRLARAGNFIDFGAMEKVDDQKLLALLDDSARAPLPERTVKAFQEELARARRIAYCTDNCGEILLDKLLIETLKDLFPDLQITVIVRGKPVINDATLEDARQVGLLELVPVIGNDTDIPGTQLEEISAEAGEVLRRADFIISKGQGNFETLHGSGLNIFYLFLCKCDYFVERFGMKRYEGVFIREREIKES